MDDRKIIVAVCGDSYCAASVNDLKVTGTGRRAHFSQMLEDVYGYQVMYMAHGGFSNAGIWFQIREALQRNADVIVYNKTWSNRLEIFNNDKFYIGHGLRNFFYYDPHLESTAETWVGNNSAPVISTTHHGVDQSPFFSITAEQKKAIDLYLKYLYNDAMQTHIDSWVFEYWHNKILQQGRVPILFNQDGIGKIAYEFSFANQNYDTPFHTDRATQEQIASNIHRYIVDNLSKSM